MMQGASENQGILIYAPVEDGGLGHVDIFQILRGTVSQEKDLQVEGPGAHIRIEIGQVWIVGDRLEGGLPAQAGADALSEGGFSRADVACYDYQTFDHEILSVVCF
jgi:hypothetical protein